LFDIPVRVKGAEAPLRTFAGAKATLIVNVASGCGFTPQYKGLQALYDELKDKGLGIVGAPCNQFGGQEPGTEAEIEQFTCDTFKVSFPLTAKLDVNGPKAHPLFVALKSQPGGKATGMAALLGDDLKWNFSKFLVDREGRVVGRFGSTTTPEQIKADIEKLLV
jgi:glutathione peroxidase